MSSYPKGWGKLVEMQGRCRDGSVQAELVPVPTRGEDWSEGLRAELAGTERPPQHTVPDLFVGYTSTRASPEEWGWLEARRSCVTGSEGRHRAQ